MYIFDYKIWNIKPIFRLAEGSIKETNLIINKGEDWTFNRHIVKIFRRI